MEERERGTSRSSTASSMGWGMPTRPPATSTPSRVQALYELCKRTFPSPSSALYELCKRTFPSPSSVAASSSPSSPPPDHAIRAISSLMDTITPVDVGLRDDNLEDGRGFGFFESNFLKNSARVARWAQPITYLHVYECDAFSAVIPLHDHPGMTVLSKLLYGSMHVKSYDWVEPAVLASGKPVRLGKLHTDDVLNAPCPTAVFSGGDSVGAPILIPEGGDSWRRRHTSALARDGFQFEAPFSPHYNVILALPLAVLYPQSGGNMHCFTSVKSCAVLDVIAPPYSESSGPAGQAKVVHGPDNYAWLEALNVPVNINMRPGMYTGPTIQEHLP
uniref:cysteine dioxygenase n=1 Tax=Oryza rufipogon TaxID=4529 RepID=A0A0E0QE08_ORYRU